MPQIVIPVTEGKNLSVIIEAAVSNYILIEQGIDSNEDFKQRVRDYLLQQNKENQK